MMRRMSLSLFQSPKGMHKHCKVIFSGQNRRLFKTSPQFGLAEKDAVPSQHHSTKGEMAARSSNAQNHADHTNKYEPTLVGNPKSSQNVSSVSSPSLSLHSLQPPENIGMDSAPSSGMQRFTERDCLDSILNQVDPKTVHRVFYFDTLAFTKKLEVKGFTRDQAEGAVECLLEIIGTTLDHQAKHMITKSEQKIAEHQLQTEIMSVKKDMVLLQKSEFSALRTETEKIGLDITRIQSHFDDEIVKLKGQFTLDINLERGRAVEAHAANEKSVQMLNHKIETEIAHLKTTYEVYRNDIFKYAAGTVLTCTTLIIGFIRLWT